MTQDSNDKLNKLVEILRNTSYRAPMGWDAIESELELDDLVSKLPRYRAPDKSWDIIEEDLKGREDSSELRKRHLSKWIILLIGIVVGMLCLLGVQYLFSSRTTPNYSYKSEIEIAALISEKQELDDEVNEIIEYIKDNSYLFEEEALSQFNVQLEEINSALKELKSMQKNYGIDESNNQIIARIKIDRAKLIKSMISNS